MSDLKYEMIHGVFWSGVEKYSGLVVSIIVSAVLARILSPDEYGVVAIATVFINFLSMFATMGIGPAVIQRDDLSLDDLNSIFTFSLLVGLLLSFLFILAAWPISEYYNNIQLVPVCQLLSINLFFAAANMVPNALMAKNKRFKEIAKRTLVLQTVSGLFSIAAALNGAGVYALLISPIFSSIGIFVYNHYFYPCIIDKHLTLEPIKRIFSFSSYQFLFEFVNFFSRNLDKLIVGRYLNMIELGYYEKGYRLMQLPMNNITSVINPVLQPVLRTLQGDKKDLSSKYNKIVMLIAMISFPLGITLSCCSYEIINIFYGNNWNNAVPVFKVLALSLPFQMILSTSGAMYLVCNNTKVQFWVGIRNTFTTILGFIVAIYSFGTIIAVAYAWTITLIINFVISFYILYRVVIQESLSSIFNAIIYPFLTALIIYSTLTVMNMFIHGLNVFILLGIKSFVSIAITLVVIRLNKQFNFRGTIFHLLYKK